MLFIAGVHVPLMPLFDDEGKVKLVPAHTAAIGVKLGTTGVLTTTVNVVVVPHCPAVGLKVYVVVALLLMAGVQEPAMPLFEVVGKVKLPPIHMGAMAVKVGVTPVEPAPVAATLMLGAPPPDTGIFPLYACAAVGENFTYIGVEASVPPPCGIVNVEV